MYVYCTLSLYTVHSAARSGVLVVVLYIYLGSSFEMHPRQVGNRREVVVCPAHQQPTPGFIPPLYLACRRGGEEGGWAQGLVGGGGGLQFLYCNYV